MPFNKIAHRNVSSSFPLFRIFSAGFENNFERIIASINLSRYWDEGCAVRKVQKKKENMDIVLNGSSGLG